MSPKHVRYSLCLVFALGALLLSVTYAAAQGAGTPNVKAAAAYTGPTRAFVDCRWWDGSGNATVSGGFQGKLGNTSEARLIYLDLDMEGVDPIASVVRRSSMKLLSADFKFELVNPGDGGLAISLNPGLEIAVERPRGQNTSTGHYAQEADSGIPTCALPISWQWGRAAVMVEPKAAWFDTLNPTTLDTAIPSFGTVVGIGIGVRIPIGGRLSLFGDITPIVHGDNRMNKDTNHPEDEMVWGAGGTLKLGSATNLSFFGTTAFGNTTATSLLAAPDNSVGFGVKLDRDL